MAKRSAAGQFTKKKPASRKKADKPPRSSPLELAFLVSRFSAGFWLFRALKPAAPVAATITRAATSAVGSPVLVFLMRLFK